MKFTADFSPIAEDSPQDPTPSSCNAVHEEDTAAAYDGIEARPQIHTDELLQHSDSLPVPDGKKSLQQFEGERGRNGSTTYEEQAAQAVQQSLEATEEAELADDLQDLSGSINGLEIVPGQPAGSQPTSLQQLLQICNQSVSHLKHPCCLQLWRRIQASVRHLTDKLSPNPCIKIYETQDHIDSGISHV